MHCPKCQQTFEENSRRFCPTDGARLISDSVGRQGSPGVFANLLAKIETDDKFDEILPDVPHFVITEPEPEIGQTPLPDDDDFFFELGDMDDELGVDTLRDIRPEPQRSVEILHPIEAAPRRATRKISPYEIPAGHVNLDDTERVVPFSLDFDTEDPESFVGRIVKGRYKVSEFLGGDESGIAFLADDKIVEDRKVLVRILLTDPTDEIIGSILAEERVSLSHFSHPNIARLIDSGTFTNGKEFLVSEFVDALSIADILSIHGQFSEQRTGRIIKQIAAALSEAHQEGILHRDLRPENLILDTAEEGENEQTILVNFGASNGEPTPQNLPYKAPEVLEGRTTTIASDVFSLAVVAYEMLTGRLPFSGATAKAILRSQNAGHAVLPSDIRHELSPAVDEVLAKAISYAPSDRYVKVRDFGDALFAALAEPRAAAAVAEVSAEPVRVSVKAAPAAPIPAPIAPAVPEPPKPAPAKVASEPAWKNRSPEPPTEETSRAKIFAGVGILALLAALGFGWYYLVNRPERLDVPPVADHVNDANNATISSNTEMPPLARTIQQPPNTNFYQNSKQNLRGDLLRNFVGFTMFYPKEWKMNGPQASASATARGKFIDIARLAPDGRMQEQMLVGYYPSKGTYMMDADTFPQLVNETNETLKKILPGYQMVSSGEIKLNGDWRAYEIKFQAGGTSASGEKLIVWGRRLFIPAARPAVRNGFEITMLATSLGEEIRSVDDVGVKGQLAQVLYSFEPSQNF